MELSKFKLPGFVDIRSKFKVFILFTAFLIGSLSIFYTQRLVNKLAEREQKLVDLYAKGLKFVADPENNGNLTFLFQEIIEANNSIPVILTDEKGIPIRSKNIDFPKNATSAAKQKILLKEVAEMKNEHPPIVVEPAPGFKNLIYYKNSYLLRQLTYYPYVQLTVIAIFSIIAFMAFSYSKNAEQNRVWVGLAKETAHQLGTPLSSLMAWVELFKSDPAINQEVVDELGKDVSRLEMITSRFSNIGSVPALTNEDIYKIIEHTLNYLRTRVSQKVQITLISNLPEATTAKINKPLFDWVIENISKNAVDAMDGKGQIQITINPYNNNQISLDIADSGKGIHKSKLKEVFKAGYTTKKRGWGLGLTLVKRIVENYHKGKIFVLNSEIGKGTTFRIILNQ